MADGTTPLLRMENISKSYGGVRALQDVQFTAERGRIHALLGENGAGKSTLMKVLSGVYPAGTYEGEIRFEGELPDGLLDEIAALQEQIISGDITVESQNSP